MSEPITSRRERRRAGRILAMQLLYGFEQKGYRDDGLLRAEDGGQVCDAEGEAFAQRLFQGWQQERKSVDAVVDGRLQNWTLGRLAVVDRCLLRLGVYEIIYCLDIPPKAAINEYVDLAKEFGSEAKSSKLVNGVLDAVAKQFPRGAPPVAPAASDG